MDETFSQKILKLLSRLNCVDVKDAVRRGCQPLYIDNKQVGLIRGDFWLHLKAFSDTFVQIQSDTTDLKDGLKAGIHLHGDLQTYESRTRAVNKALEQLRDKGVINALNGWRYENYAVSQAYNDKALLEIERAGCGLFGCIGYGVYVNGFTRDKDGRMWMWIGRRSKTKQTFPDMFDNMCAGGLPTGMGIKECVIKECQEEASISDDILEKLRFTGTISYFYEDERGLFPECQYIFDLEVPEDFKPVNADGEVGSFEKIPVDKLKNEIGENFTPTSAAVCLDFLIRHGLMDPDSDPNCCFYVEQMHSPLQTYYDEN